MGDSTKKTNWEKISKIIRKEDSEQKDQLFNSKDLTEPNKNVADIVKVPTDIITNYKKNKIQRKAGVDMLNEWYKGQLIVAKEYISHLVKIKSSELDIEAAQVLRELNQRHLDYLGELGMRNIKSRGELLIKLNDESADLLARILEKGDEGKWSPEMVEKTVNSVSEMHQKFFEKIINEEFGVN